MPTYNPNDVSAVQDYYRRYTGREAGAEDPQTWLSGGYGYGTDLGSIEKAISSSDEARAYASRQPQTGTAQPNNPNPPPPTSGTNPPARPQAQQPNYWDPNVFNQIVGRAPTAAETNWYSQAPDWYTQVEHNTTGYHETNPWSAGAFQQVTGRAPTDTEAAYYSQRGNNWLDEVKKNTPGYTAAAGTTAGGGTLRQRIDAALKAAKSTDDPNYWYQKIEADPNGGGSAWDYWVDRINRGNGAGLGLPLYNDGPGGGLNYGGTNVFSDPATQQFEQLLNGMIQRFVNPQTPAGYQQAIDQMNAYLTKLNGPVYTPAQMELLQTQALNPLQQQHDAAKQQLIQRLGAQGISPSSGIFEKALEDLDRQFEQARTQTQAGFAANAVGLDRQNAATAAQLAPQISNFQQAQTGWQDQRALQGEQLAYLIPQMAQQRLTGAAGAVQPINPTSLLTMLQQFQNQGYNQGAGYGSAITQLLAQLFGL